MHDLGFWTGQSLCCQHREVAYEGDPAWWQRHRFFTRLALQQLFDCASVGTRRLDPSLYPRSTANSARSGSVSTAMMSVSILGRDTSIACATIARCSRSSSGARTILRINRMFYEWNSISQAKEGRTEPLDARSGFPRRCLSSSSRPHTATSCVPGAARESLTE